MSGYHTESVNGTKHKLAAYETVEPDWKCPNCGGDLITSHGPGIEPTMCLSCGWEFTDYE